MSDKQSNELDQMLDRTLAAYALQLPLGLESRVLQHVVGSESKRRRRGWFTLGGSACALVAIAVLSTQPVQVKRVNAQTRLNPIQLAKASTHPPTVRMIFPEKRKQKQSPGRANIFPYRTPLSSEERALVRFVEQSPEAAEKAFSSLHQQDAEPLHIEALNIVPLADEPLHSGEKP